MSSGPWKKHKYFKKIGEGANAVYKYAKQVKGAADYARENKSLGGKEQQEYYDAQKDARFLDKRAGWDEEWIKDWKDYEGLKSTDKIQVMKDLSGAMVDGDSLARASREQAKGAKRTAYEKKKVYDKTAMGVIDNTLTAYGKSVERGQEKILKLFGRG